jgi:hypothetical protein
MGLPLTLWGFIWSNYKFKLFKEKKNQHTFNSVVNSFQENREFEKNSELMQCDEE